MKDKTCKINAAYAKATPAERRRMIAKDALKQIKAEKFMPTSGNWADVKLSEDRELDWEAPLQPHLLAKGTTCECCGVGAVFLSYVRLANHATYDDGWDFDTIQKSTKWPVENLRLIEAAFERGHGYISPSNGIRLNEQEKAAAEWGASIADHNEDDGPERRLIAILKNIASNPKGLFKP